MKVNLGLGPHNSFDTMRFHEGDRTRIPVVSDSTVLQKIHAIGDLAEPLGFDGLWFPQHFGSPYGMCPNPLQVLAYFAGRTERITFGTMILVAPWWHPVQLAHEIAYLDNLSSGRYEVIGLGRGVAKAEFDCLGVPRDESRQRLDETIDILTAAFTQESFSFEGEVFTIPETSIRPAPVSSDLAGRLHGASSTGPSLEKNARAGLTPLFVGNKPLDVAAQEVRRVNEIRREAGLSPVQPKNVLFAYCAPTDQEAVRAAEYVEQANRDVRLHYGFDDPSNFVGVKGYESYAEGKGSATAVTAGPSRRYDESNLLIGSPETIIERVGALQKVCSFSEITINPYFGEMPLAEVEASVRLFAKEVLPVLHEMEAPLHPDASGE
ncbi:LLM class flavin-dependent oxidoreductase [Microbacterium immunditiarum]|uniref:Alkanesulfonate monooxygenase SsuD/methylene tetrahydromethanopterin reductase-like flavin-dependent oxidoreductase (Luciferase family) n=1 Tax=Microbacterium immunditiarum TaxID=337480 RepID=A0A7Y9GRT1_9MICO|nr:LLM class flavin-dependent oxidoreductase [Microbacterium immunditiarum]NYE21510.1 alkanesulfonate monooxygenase SsuD/methylene tetrahydromethanopterin reductase-like flavin-dependent oxidoreductase (luciferase family) [Microbacterium immunditiarum]